jgi:hypothetical protein
MNFHAFWQETLAAALPAPGESRAPALGAHAGAEAVLLFPCSLRSL